MRCCICGTEIVDDIHDANNPSPLKDENGKDLAADPNNVCCRECDNNYVTTYRISLYCGNPKGCKEIQERVLELRKEWLNHEQSK